MTAKTKWIIFAVSTVVVLALAFGFILILQANANGNEKLWSEKLEKKPIGVASRRIGDERL